LDVIFCAYQNANKRVLLLLLLINNYYYIKFRTFRLFFESFSTVKNTKI